MKSTGKKATYAIVGGAVLSLAVAGGAIAAGGGFGGRDGPGMSGKMGAMGLMGERGAAMDFATLDADGSGSITLEDVAALAQARFAETDANADGELSQDEVAARITARIEEGNMQPRARGGVEWMPNLDERRIAWMADGFIIRMDKDGNGTVSLQEATPDAAKMERMISRFDSDGDGAVSEEEFAAVKQAMNQHGKRGDRKGGRGN